MENDKMNTKIKEGRVLEVNMSFEFAVEMLLILLVLSFIIGLLIKAI